MSTKSRSGAQLFQTQHDTRYLLDMTPLHPEAFSDSLSLHKNPLLKKLGFKAEFYRLLSQARIFQFPEQQPKPKASQRSLSPPLNALPPSKHESVFFLKKKKQGEEIFLTETRENNPTPRTGQFRLATLTHNSRAFAQDPEGNSHMEITDTAWAGKGSLIAHGIPQPLAFLKPGNRGETMDFPGVKE